MHEVPAPRQARDLIAAGRFQDGHFNKGELKFQVKYIYEKG